MKLKKRLILSYTILAIFASVIIGAVYYHYLSEKYRIKMYNNIETSSMTVRNNLTSELKKCQQVTLSLLSDMDVLDAIRDLSKRMGSLSTELDEATVISEKNLVRNAVYTAYNLENFYRVVVFNRYGYIGASAVMQERVLDTNTNVDGIEWLEQVKNTGGKSVLIGRHIDDWAAKENGAEVISIVREIQGDHLGYVEVQILWTEFENLFRTLADNMQIIAVTAGGEVLYASDGLETSSYSQYYDSEEGTVDRINNGRKETISVSIDEEFQVRLLLIANWEDGMADTDMPYMLGMSGIFFVLSLAFIILMANIQTRPLYELRQIMEKTQLLDLPENVTIKNSDADVDALLKAYQDLMIRLKKSAEQEKKLSLLQLQAQFDTLQAQINPHFLYNVLNIISSRGMQDDDETICDICGQLAAMLRYSINTKERYARIKEELDYTREYFYLLHARYGDNLTFDIQVPDLILDEIIPKTVLQQIAENSINHGFANSRENMRVAVRGYKEESGWQIKISDNGDGFSLEALKELREKMERTKRLLFKERSNIELEIGGLGLVNAYARMLLIYNDKLIFHFDNTEEGAEVTIGVKE